jgi:hypothetical protein
VRELLRSPNIEHSAELKNLFVMGPKYTGQFVAALNDPGQTVSDNAQFMIELLADPRGIEQLKQWRMTRPIKRFVIGPITPPLGSDIYGQIDTKFLRSPYINWRSDEAINYAFALSIEDSSAAHLTLMRMLEDVPESAKGSDVFDILKRLQHSDIGTPFCAAKHIETAVLAHSVFLSTSKRKTTSIELMAEDADDGRALLREFQPFGAYFLITIRRKGPKCWGFQSIFFAGLN